MVSPKRNKFSNSLKKIPRSKIGSESVLSKDLAEKVGNISDKTKVTIRLDDRVIEAAKELDRKLGGVGYQKIINDRLLAAFGFQSESNLKDVEFDTIKKLLEEVSEIKSRLSKLERRKVP